MKKFFTGCISALLLVGVMAGCGHWNKDKNQVAIAVSPADPSIAKELTRQFTALGIYDDGTSVDISSQVAWSSSNLANASISAGGLATGLAVGTSVITATLGGNSGTTTLTVTPATLRSIVIAPANARIVKDLTNQFTALGIYSDGTSADITSLVTWASSDTTVSSFNANGTAISGLATGVSAGPSAITATFGGQTGTGTLTITASSLRSVSVTPATPNIVKGQSNQFTALGIYNDGTSADISSLVAWSTSDASVAALNASGLATGVITGQATISATFGGQTGTANLTVTPATLNSIAVATTSPSVVKGLPSQFTALGVYSDGTSANITPLVTWASGNTSVAIMNANGLASSGQATGVNAGSSTISATLGSQTGTANLVVTAATLNAISVTPATPTTVVGLTSKFTAMGTYNDGTSADITPLVTWASGDTAVAIMNANGLASSGLASGVKAGTSTISATFGGQTGTANLTVTAAALKSIVVTPLNPGILPGQNQKFTATGSYDDGSFADLTASVLWSSSDITIATLNADGSIVSGLATGVAQGQSIIAATFGGKTGSTTLNVIGSNPWAPVMGETARFVILASQKITTTAGSLISNGDLGILDQARSYYEGFTAGAAPGALLELTNGLSYAHDDIAPALIPFPYASTIAFIDQVRTDLGIAYSFLAADPNPSGVPTQVCPTELGNLVLTRGVYKTGSNVTLQTGPLHLDAQGDPTSVFIFTIDGTLTTGAPGGSIVLDGGAQAKNVYWRTSGTTILGPGTAFSGNVFAWQQVNLLAGATVTGRLFSVNEQVTLITNNVTKAP